MVSYNYENLFFEHFATNYVVVDSGATVTKVTGVAPVISGEAFKIENELIKAESVKLSESLCSEKNLVFGKIEASKLSFSFKDDDSIPHDISGEEIDVYLYFDYDSATLFKVGRYTIENDKYSDNNFVRNITAYDMNYYLKDTDITSWYYGYYGDGQKHMLGLAIVNLFNWLRDPNDDYEDSPKINIQLENGYNLCNGLFAFGQTIESDSITFEYYMQRVLEWNGCFGHINRKGNFEFVVMQWYDKDPVRTVTNEDRIPPTEHDIVSTWGIGGVDVYDKDNVRICKYRNTNKKHPSIYSIADSFVTAEYEKGDSTLKAAVKKLHNVIHHLNYKSCNVKTTGDLCVEVGDRINVNVLPDEGESKGWFRSYCLERTYSGIQGMIDIYKSKGDKKQPKYVIDKGTSHSGDSDQGVDGSDGVTMIDDEHDRHFCEIIRNIGYRVLDEPSDVECKYDDGNMNVKFKWTDPADINTTEPEDCTWAGTIVVRKVGSRPIHEWDGTVIVDSTTRDAYKNTYLVDNTIEEDKQYYYGIFPYHYKNGKRWTRFTKVISVNTSKFIDAPTIYSAILDEDTGITTVTYSVPAGTYDFIKLVYKNNGIPTDENDGTAIDILQSSTTQTINGLSGTVWFCIFTDKTSSEPAELRTGIVGQNFFVSDANTDGRDTMNYNGNATVSITIDYSSGGDPPTTVSTKQGKMTPIGTEASNVSVSGGTINYTGTGTLALAWAYDTSIVNQRVFPKNCKAITEANVYFTNGEGYLDIRSYSTLNNPGNHTFYYCFDTKYAFASDIWYNIKCETTVVNGRATAEKYYVNDTLIATTSVDYAWMCVDDVNPVPNAMITFTLTAPTKIKDFSIYYEVE